MKCEAAQEYITLAVYGELPDEVRHELEHHLAVCEDCRRELQAVEALHQAMYLYRVEEPSANLLTRARMHLEEALDALPQRSWLARLGRSVAVGASRLRSAPVAASMLLAAGIGMGGLGGFHLARTAQPAAAPNAVAVAPQDDSSVEVANVSSIVRQPNSEMVEVHYNRLVPETLAGSLHDPQVRQLLLIATQGAGGPAVRDNSVGLLAAECRAGHLCDGGPVRDALMVSLRYDKSPAVRLKALEGLQPYIGEDQRVRDAVLGALLHDSDAEVRQQAIGLLEPVEADSSVRQVLHTVAAQDENPNIRTVSRQVLSQLPEIQ